MKALLFLVLFASVYANMDLILLKKYPEAQCLDGSPSGIHFEKGWGTGAD
jgi:hypothetical protein